MSWCSDRQKANNIGAAAEFPPLPRCCYANQRLLVVVMLAISTARRLNRMVPRFAQGVNSPPALRIRSNPHAAAWRTAKKKSP